jgi:hypothetical protein
MIMASSKRNLVIEDGGNLWERIEYLGVASNCFVVRDGAPQYFATLEEAVAYRDANRTPRKKVSNVVACA